jgi:hypothetical protein
MLAAMGLAAGGCSLIFLDGPPPRHETLQSFDCTSSRVAPVLDAALAGLLATATISAATDDSAGSAAGAVMAASLAGAAMAASAHGFVQTEHCAAAKGALQARAVAPAFARGPFVTPAPGRGVDPWLAAGPPPFPAFPAPPPPPAPSLAPDGGAP